MMKRSGVKGMMFSLRIGGITMFLMTILVLMVEFLLDWLGMNLGIFSGGAIPLMVGMIAGFIVTISIWRRRSRTITGNVH
jgi:hypothetical protein